MQIPKINVNVGVYVVSLMAIGYAERYQLPTLLLMGQITGWISLASVVICIIPYTYKYFNSRWHTRNNYNSPSGGGKISSKSK